MRSISCALNVDILLSKSSAVWNPVRPQAGHDVLAGHAGGRAVAGRKCRDSSARFVEFAFGDFQRPLAVFAWKIASPSVIAITSTAASGSATGLHPA